MKTLNYNFTFFILLLFVLPILAGDGTAPKEVKNEIKDPVVEGKQWNRWTTKNFVICSINNDQAQYLNKNLEDLKTWIYTRWGFSDMDFNSELPNNAVYPIVFDSLNNIWVGTEGGIARFNGEKEWLAYNTENSGLPNNKVYSMCPNTITFGLACNEFMLLKKSILRFLENTKFFLRFCAILS